MKWTQIPDNEKKRESNVILRKSSCDWKISNVPPNHPGIRQKSVWVIYKFCVIDFSASITAKLICIVCLMIEMIRILPNPSIQISTSQVVGLLHRYLMSFPLSFLLFLHWFYISFVFLYGCFKSFLQCSYPCIWLPLLLETSGVARSRMECIQIKCIRSTKTLAYVHLRIIF